MWPYLWCIPGTVLRTMTKSDQLQFLLTLLMLWASIWVGHTFHPLQCFRWPLQDWRWWKQGVLWAEGFFSSLASLPGSPASPMMAKPPALPHSQPCSQPCHCHLQLGHSRDHPAQPSPSALPPPTPGLPRHKHFPCSSSKSCFKFLILKGNYREEVSGLQLVSGAHTFTRVWAES